MNQMTTLYREGMAILREENEELKKRVNELETFIEQLIDAGDRLTANPELYDYEEAEQKWTELWLSWKTQKEQK